jgi:molecular chaperone HscB
VVVVSPSASDVVDSSLQGLSLQSSDFELLGVPECFALDADLLSTRWKSMQAQTHPDKFAVQGPVAQRIGMQWSVRINEAYQRLKSPVSRGAYLCERRGHPVRAEDNTAMPSAFLMQQMEWREALDDGAHDITTLEGLQSQTRAAQAEWLSQLQRALDDQGDAAQAAGCVRALMFIEKFSRSVAQRLDDLDA